MEDGQASVVVLSPAGQQFTINFMTDYFGYEFQVLIEHRAAGRRR
jgi:hypothetical protein